MLPGGWLRACTHSRTSSRWVQVFIRFPRPLRASWRRCDKKVLQLLARASGPAAYRPELAPCVMTGLIKLQWVLLAYSH